MPFVYFFGAAILEIAGCYLVWLATRQGPSWLWLPALLCLALFALLLAMTGTDSAGRAFLRSMAAFILRLRWRSWWAWSGYDPMRGIWQV